jgi:hemerythrin superfamily protein
MSEVGRILREDHRKVQKLFEEFEAAREKRRQGEIAAQAMNEIEIHSTIEEEIVYPVLRDAKKGEELFQEAQEEHHVVKVLMEELRDMRPSEENFAAKFNVLAENVKHHIGEEEGQMLPALEKTDFDDAEMSEEIMARKDELMSTAGAGNAPRRKKAATPKRKSSRRR